MPVTPEVKTILDLLAAVRGAAHRAADARASCGQGYAAMSAGRVQGRDGVGDRPHVPRPGGRHPGAGVRAHRPSPGRGRCSCTSTAAAGSSATSRPTTRRSGPWRPRSGVDGGVGRLPAGARAPVPGRGRRLPGRGAVGGRRRRPSSTSTRPGWPSAATRRAATWPPWSRAELRDTARRVRFQLLVYPVTDGTLSQPSIDENAEGYFLTKDTMAWFWDHYVGAGDRTRPAGARRCTPPTTALAGLPPALVITAEFDPLRDEGEAYAARLAAAGVDGHGQPLRRRDPRVLLDGRHGPRGQGRHRPGGRGAAPTVADSRRLIGAASPSAR